MMLQQPYMHHSRHLHAMRRPRGSGGRFLNSNKADPGKQSKGSTCQNSEVFHPEDETMTHPSRETYVPKVSGSQVTSMDYFLSSSVHSLGGMVTPSKWIASSMDVGCCDLKTWSANEDKTGFGEPLCFSQTKKGSSSFLDLQELVLYHPIWL